MVEIGHNAYGQSQTQTKDIDQGIDFIFVKIPEGDKEIVSKHPKYFNV